MATTLSNKIMAWLNVSKSTLKAGQAEQLTVEFSRDPGALSTADFTVTGGALSNLEGMGLVRTLTFTAGPNAGDASVSLQGGDFITIPSSPLQVLAAPHSIAVRQIDAPAPQPVAQNFQPTVVPGKFQSLPTLSGHANPNSTIKLIFAHDDPSVIKATDAGTNSKMIAEREVKDPLGGYAAQKLISTSANGSTFVEAFKNTTIALGEYYTLSAYVKAAGSNFVQVVGNSATFGNLAVNFDVSRGEVTKTQNPNNNFSDAHIVSVGDGWYRIDVTAKAIGSSTSNHMSIGLVKTGLSNRGDGASAANSGIDVWGFSFEKSKAPPPVIATVKTGADGVWTYTPTAPLPDGDYTVKAAGASTINGLPSNANGLATFTVDTIVSAPTITVASSGNAAPLVSGSAEKLAIIDVVFRAADGESHDYKVQAAADGRWSVDTSKVGLTGGKSWTVVAHQTDAAGNVSQDSASTTMTSPMAPTQPKQDVLSGHANPDSTIKLIFAHDDPTVITATNAGTNSKMIAEREVKDPLGGYAAQKLISISANGSTFVEAFTNTTIALGEYCTISAYVKAAGSSFVQVVGSSATFGNLAVNFDVSGGAVTKTFNPDNNFTSAHIESVGDGWYRIDVTAKAIGSSASSHMSIGLVKTGISNRGDGAPAANSGIDVWGFSFEKSKAPAPLIATVNTDADGEWSYNAGVLADGKYLVTTCPTGGSTDQTLKLTVANGVVSTPEANAAAIAPVAPTVKMGDAYHVDATGSWTNKHDVTIEGMGKAGSTITIFEANSPMKGADGHGDRTQLGTATVGQDGHWSFNATGLSEGEHTIYTEQTTNGVTDTSIENIIFPGYIVQSHRDWGVPSVWSQAKPEETIVAAENVIAQNLGVSYFDGDTRSTKDGVLILLHDAGPDMWGKATGGAFHGISDNMTYDYIYNNISVGANIGQQARVATFEELVIYAKSMGMSISMEVRSPDQCIAAMEIVQRYGMVQHVIFNSFYDFQIKPALDIDPDARLCLLTYGASAAQIELVKSWGPNASILSSNSYKNSSGVTVPLDQATVDRCNAAGVKIGVWTQATNDQFNQMRALGITTFCNDGPITGAVAQPVLHLTVDTHVEAPSFTITPDATKIGTYDLQGKAEAYARIDIFDAKGQFLKTVKAEGGGLWTAELPIGAEITYLQARQTDQANNESALSNGVLVQNHFQLSEGMLSSQILTAPSSAVAGLRGAVAIGDFNHDGVQDYIIKSGSSAIVTSSGSKAVLATLTTDPDGGTVGTSFAGLGDTNGDGYADVIIGSAGTSGFNAAFVLLGSSSPEGSISTLKIAGGASVHGYVIRAEENGVKTGLVVAAAGDINGDGLNDMIVTAQDGGGLAGKVYVVFGKTDTDAVYLRDVALGAGGFVIDGIPGAHAGATAFGAGDLNGDGFADLVIGDTAGHQYVVYGGPQFITQTSVNGKTLINGTSGDDTLTGMDSAEVIVGGTGNDVIDGKGGADVLLGGDGSDAFIFGAAMARSNTFLKVNGGAGYDKIELHDGVTFDLSAIMNLGADRVVNIEKIDMTIDALHNEVSLSSASILAAGGQMTLGSTTFAHGLTIDGASNDTIHLTAADGWRVDTTAHDPAYDLYVASNGAHLMVHRQVQFDLH